MKFGQYSTFAFVDVETTGTSASQNRILELGVIRVKDGVVVGEMNTLLDPQTYIPEEITMITGINSKDVENASHFSDVADELSELLNGAVFVAHNARFDHAFIKHEYRRLGLPFTAKTLDTVRLSRHLYPTLAHHNLDAIISLLNIKIKNRHRAYDDAKVLFDFMKNASLLFPAEKLHPIIENLLKTPSLPPQINKADIEKLPECPGVYLMYGENDALLYVGKSTDIKARVLSHFYNDFESGKDLKLAKEVKRLEALKTAGDLGASLLESKLIKEKLPLYNTFLRQGRASQALLQDETKEGYFTVKIVDFNKIDPKGHHKILQVVRNNKNTKEHLSKLVKEHHLCEKLVGFSPSKRGEVGCFGSQIGICYGACMGAEPAFKYNVRFLEAFGDSRVPNWPFPGPIGIKEQFEDLEEVHIINNWCYLGSVKNINDDLESILSKKPIFDWDNYKLIQRFVKKQVKSKFLILLSQASHSSPTEPL